MESGLLATSLGGIFWAAVARFPRRPALEIDGVRLSYAQLGALAAALAYRLEGDAPGEDFVGVFGGRQLGSYVGILGVLSAGRAYVPLNPKFPPDRTARMIERAGLRSVVLAPGTEEDFAKLPAALRARLRVIHPRQADAPAPKLARPVGRYAYLLFTSGSTGEPKGIAISHANARAYFANLRRLAPLNENDRCSQTFDLTFDLSVHDLFSCWGAGACLFPLADADLLLPQGFIREHGLTSWFSVPSLANTLAALRALKPGRFPLLRWSLFCGEGLPAATAQKWAEAAPDSRVINLYGPTEATIAFTHHEWRANPAADLGGLVPIGQAFDDQSTALLDPESGRLLEGPARGELLLEGSQVADGYWHDPEKTADRFARIKGRRYYRSGDLAERDASGCLHFRGRLDFQVKIRGYRIELSEVEATLRKAEEGLNVVCLGWPLRDGQIQGITACIEGEPDLSLVERLQRASEAALPDYMRPARFEALRAFPLNANGKIDRRALEEFLLNIEK
jgi:amino acid adenylation domain-containing protein